MSFEQVGANNNDNQQHLVEVIDWDGLIQYVSQSIPLAGIPLETLKLVFSFISLKLYRENICFNVTSRIPAKGML